MVEEKKTNLAQETVEKEIVDQSGVSKDKPNFSKRLWNALVIFAALIVLMVGFFWASNKGLTPFRGKLTHEPTSTSKTTPTFTPLPKSAAEAEKEISDLEKQSSSDEISAIEDDLLTTDLSSLDQELKEIEAELETP